MNPFTKTTIYETDRLQVRPLRKKDFDPFHEMQANPLVMQYVAKRPNTRAENDHELQELIQSYQKKDNEFWVWAISHKEEQKFIGTVALIKDKEDNWEIGYRLLQKEWGNGYATEALTGLIDFCTAQPDIDNLIAYADRRNMASQRVLTKCGFVNLGIKYNEEEDCEDYIYSISTTQ